MFSAFPQWQASRLALSRLLHPRPVLVMISDSGLLCCWKGGQQWMFRSALWPQGACRDGLPLQREAMAELIADLLFDLDLPGAELVLSLPPSAATWCIVDGLTAEDWDSQGSLRERLGSAELPFDLEQSYLTTSSSPTSVVVAGVPRSLVQAWVEVVESADLPLRRMTWSLVDAQRALAEISKDWSDDLAWLVVHGGVVRLILIRAGVPEVDYMLSSQDFHVCLLEARACLRAWQQTLDSPAPLAWWLTLDEPNDDDWHQIIDTSAGEKVLNQPLPWSPDPWNDADEAIELPSLEHLALMALHREESW